MAVILPSEIEYQPFSTEQVAAFAVAAGLEYQNPDLPWLDDLNEAARDLLFEYGSKDWPTPSAMRKQLESVKRDPDGFIRRLDVEPELRDSPLATAILHGTRWHPEKLATAADHREGFIAGVDLELEWVNRIIERRKEDKATGHGGNPAMTHFIDRLTLVFQDAFWQEVNVGLSVPTSSRKLIWNAEPSGPFIRFVKSVVKAIECNLPEVLRNGHVATVLRGVAGSGSAIRNRLDRSENYKLAKVLTKAAKI